MFLGRSGARAGNLYFDSRFSGASFMAVVQREGGREGRAERRLKVWKIYFPILKFPQPFCFPSVGVGWERAATTTAATTTTTSTGAPPRFLVPVFSEQAKP